jgi:hypothetical protein
MKSRPVLLSRVPGNGVRGDVRSFEIAGGLLTGGVSGLAAGGSGLLGEGNGLLGEGKGLLGEGEGFEPPPFPFWLLPVLGAGMGFGPPRSPDRPVRSFADVNEFA